jgi:hypothetical protein
MAQLFISYVEEDAAIAQALASEFESAGYSTWRYQRDSVPGPSYLLQTSAAIDESEAVILVISTHSLKSHQVSREIVRAHESQKPIIPLLLGVTHGQLRSQQPEWRQAIGAAAALSLDERHLSLDVEAILRGLRVLGLEAHATSSTTLPVTNSASSRALRYFLYISDAKLAMMQEQILWRDKPIASPSSRFELLPRVLQELDNADLVGDIGSDKPYVRGEYVVRWGVVDWGVRDRDVRAVFFFTRETNPILLMSGSVHHLVAKPARAYDYPAAYFGHSGSDLPGIVAVVNLSTGPQQEWLKYTSNLGHYLSVVDFVEQDQKPSEDTPPFQFAEQRVEFVARVLRRIPLPSDSDRSGDGPAPPEFVRWVEDRLNGWDRDVLICTPLYVALSDKC